MKYLSVILALLIILSACAFSPVVDQATFDVTATARAQPVPPLPTMDDPTVPPTVELPTVTPTPCPLVIKGNINAQHEKIAHSPGQANYAATQIDESKGEKWFCSLEQAEAEGWRPAQK